MARTEIDSWEAFDVVEDIVADAVHEGLEQAAEDELEASQRAYTAEQDVLGRPWKELSPVTIAKKGHDTILVESGKMKNSGYVKSDDESVKVGYSDPKVPIHEYGTENIPARPIVGPMRLDLAHNRLEETVAKTVEERVNGIRMRGR